MVVAALGTVLAAGYLLWMLQKQQWEPPLMNLKII